LLAQNVVVILPTTLRPCVSLPLCSPNGGTRGPSLCPAEGSMNKLYGPATDKQRLPKEVAPAQSHPDIQLDRAEHHAHTVELHDPDSTGSPTSSTDDLDRPSAG